MAASSYWVVQLKNNSIGIVRSATAPANANVTGSQAVTGALNAENVGLAINKIPNAARAVSGGGRGIGDALSLPAAIKDAQGKGSGLIYDGNIGHTAALAAFGVFAAGIAAAAGVAVAGAGGGTAAAGAGAGAADTAAEDAGSASVASNATGYASNAIKDLSSLSAAGGLAALLVDPRFLLRMAEVIGGFVLILMGIRFLANAGGANIPNPVTTASKAAVVAAAV